MVIVRAQWLAWQLMNQPFKHGPAPGMMMRVQGSLVSALPVVTTQVALASMSTHVHKSAAQN